MRFDWKPESKERYFRKAEAAVKAAGFDDILRVECFYDFRNGGAGQMKTYRQKHPYIAQIGYILRYKLQRFTWMFKVKDCRHICLFCEYYDTCRQEGKGK